MLASFWIPLAVVAGSTPLLALVARRLGWVDRRGGHLEQRKPRREPVALVGGPALLLGLLAAQLGGAEAGPWGVLLAAFCLGAVDDLRADGLPVRSKLCGQLLVALLVALECGGSSEERVLVGLVALLAMNAANTFDCADGSCAALGLTALWGRAIAAPALLGFLPWNLFVRRGRERVPLTYLGDSGSHLVGVWIAMTPEAWTLLTLPLLDLARLSWVRWRSGGAPWRGDRRHLAHRLERRGLGPLGVALVFVLLLAPGRLLADPVLAAVTTAVLMAVALVLTSERGSPDRNQPCRGTMGPG